MSFLSFLGFKKMVDDGAEVLDFPKPKAVPYVEPPKPKEEPARIYYRFGMTDNNRVAFSMGYSEITMNREGCQNLIDEITFYMNKIDDDTPEDDPDGGIPIPIPEQKAA